MNELECCMNACTIQEIPTGGPDTWTEEMAKKLAILNWCLKQKEIHEHFGRD